MILYLAVLQVYKIIIFWPSLGTDNRKSIIFSYVLSRGSVL